MRDTCNAILIEIEKQAKNVNGRNVMWLRESPGAGKSASIATRLQNQNRTQSAIVTIDALACCHL